MTTRLPALCWACQRRIPGGERATCEAFPRGIPSNIIDFAADHHGSYVGDSGLQFVDAGTEAAKVALADWTRYHETVTASRSSSAKRSADYGDEDVDEPIDELDLALEHYEPEKPLDPTARSRALAMRAIGQDITPGHDQLHHYWTRGEGLAKWVGSPKPWTTLVAHLSKYVSLEKAKRFASRWFIEVFHFAAGSDLNRVMHGHPPRGHIIGPDRAGADHAEQRKYNPLQPRDWHGRWTLVGAIIKALKAQGGTQGGTRYPDGRFFDWSEHKVDHGRDKYRFRVGDGHGDPDEDGAGLVEAEVDDPDMDTLFAALTATRLRDSAPPKPDAKDDQSVAVASLAAIASPDAVTIGANEELYIDWSERDANGNYKFHLENTDEEQSADFDLTPDELAQLIASLALSTQKPESVRSSFGLASEERAGYSRRHPYFGQNWRHGWIPTTYNLAKKWHREHRLGALQHLITAEDSGEKPDANGVSRHLLKGGSNGDVYLVDHNNGAETIEKRPKDMAPIMGHTGAPPERQADAEQLASLLGITVGAPVPQVLRIAADKVSMDVVWGRKWADYRADALAAGQSKAQIVADFDRIARSPEGQRLGVFDALIGNWDRGNPTNWFVEDDTDRPVGIDHALGWDQLSQGMQPDEFEARSPFLQPFVEYHMGKFRWADNPLTPDDIAFLRARLADVEEDFTKLGRHDWWEFSSKRLDELARHATGTRSLFT